MRLFAIADLHLPGGDDKPMNVFGPHWERHFERICDDWLARVQQEDCVLIPGDISWAMQLSHATDDLNAIGQLPGHKLLLKGNHDYWWTSLQQIRAILPAGMEIVQHSAVDLGECVVCGTRGWEFPVSGQEQSPEDAKIYRRELMRLEMALSSAADMAEGRPVVAMTHYPPLYQLEQSTGFTDLLERYGARFAVYGHLHGAGIRIGYNGWLRGVRYQLTSCDSLDFKLYEINLAEQENNEHLDL